MARKPALHDADDLIAPGVEATIAALDPPPSDAGLVSMARVLAHAVDRMGNAERAAMLGQTASRPAPGLAGVAQAGGCTAKAAGKPADGQPD